MKCFILAVFTVFLSQTLLAAPALWEVRKGAHSFYLGASLNVLLGKHYPLPIEFEQAFKLADKLYLERDINTLNTPEFSAQLMGAMMYTDGTKLADVLSPGVYTELQTFAQQVDVPLLGLQFFKPAFAVVSLSVAAGSASPFSQGVDAYFYALAKQKNKPVAALETPAQQIQWLQAMNEENPNTLIKNTLTELKGLERNLLKAEPLWRSGRLKALDTYTTAKLRTTTPKAYATWVVKRQALWLPQLEALAKTPAVELVLLDCIHFTGPDNVLNALKNKGYSMMPFQNPTGKSL